jgi:protein SCO1/2
VTSRRARLLLITGAAVVVTAVVAMLLIPPAKDKDRGQELIEIEPDPSLDQELEVVVDPPAFELRDHRDRPFTRADLAGHVTIAGFVFTRCQTACPVITLRMRRLQEETAREGARLQLVSFSVDPQHDTPAVLADYHEKVGADPARWKFVTGTPTEVRRIVAGSLLMAMDPDGTTQGNGAPNVVHSEHLALFDRQGRVRGYYDSSDDARLARLRDDYTRLLAE